MALLSSSAGKETRTHLWKPSASHALVSISLPCSVNQYSEQLEVGDLLIPSCPIVLSSLAMFNSSCCFFFFFC